MGFLDHSTNNIIVDAVLTDVGREKLAAATSSENFVASYAFADDEIDYTMIKKYGTIVGKEKIEKNTPVFEASTNAELGVKYFLSTSANPIVAQPTLTVDLINKALNRTTTKETSLTISLTDNEQILNAIEYDIVYDPRFVSPIGPFQPKRIPSSRNRVFISVESGAKEDQVIRFRIGTKGEEVLKKVSKTKLVTSIEVKSTTGLRKRVPIIVEYN